MNDPAHNDHAAPDAEATQAFLDSLPEIKPGQSFRFACHPKVACFNACCHDLNMPLAPYDVLRLRQELGIDSEEFIGVYTTVGQYPSGYPVLHLKMSPSPDRACFFLSPAGCTVYPGRSAACRTYPLGRATREDDAGNPLEQYFLVQEPHCLGFSEPAEWTTETWLRDQELTEYNRLNDRYMHLMALQQRTGRVLAQKHATLCTLSLYQLDRFEGFIRSMGLLDRLDLTEERKARILEDETARLEFGFDWLELVLYGGNGTLTVKA
ncbi:YkgJ family cysteine cluster protein [Desulfovibrio psychrotolerans]|uniref:Zinc/iron-chelating domain-containing protein n=1 Tax=Desulfovibrio psychrotolerans TaxID=415242 RepID=A0A7J0BY95_9BACT|nr:YkgJ family cysteine cluster protein [Desulfovibrio psychrotolerans]GFM38152.1 zinc/iron-chelating domain-containing protein [Desulfovibrio psychrotolerans]